MYQRFGITGNLRAVLMDTLEVFKTQVGIWLAVFGPLDLELEQYVAERDALTKFAETPDNRMSSNRANDAIDSMMASMKRFDGISVGPIMKDILFKRALKLDGAVHQERIISMIRDHFNRGPDGGAVLRLEKIITLFVQIEEDEAKVRARRVLSDTSIAAYRERRGRSLDRRNEDRERRQEMKGRKLNDDSGRRGKKIA